MDHDYLVTIRSVADVGYFSRFLSVGAIGAVFDNIVLIGAVELVEMAPLAAKILSAELSILLMFCINERWTFSGHGSDRIRGIARRLVTSNVVRLGGLGVGFVVLYLLHSVLGIWYLLANLLGLCLGFVVNYVSESLFTWDVS